jgi:hypothetical protein
MRVIVEQLVEWRLAGETEVFGENLPQRHFVHHKSQIYTFLGIEVYVLQSYNAIATWLFYVHEYKRTEFLVTALKIWGQTILTRVYSRRIIYHLEKILEPVWIAWDVNLLSARLIGFCNALQAYSLFCSVVPPVPRQSCIYSFVLLLLTLIGNKEERVFGFYF